VDVTRPAQLSRALRLALALAVLAWPATPAAPALATALALPARAWVSWVEPAFSVQSLGVVRHGDGRARLRLEVSLAHPVAVGEVMVLPHPRGRARAELPLAQVWLAPMLLALLLLAWPGASGPALAARAAFALPALPLLLALDAPLVLLAETWQLLRQAHGDSSFHALVGWSALLRAGGRVGLAVIAAWAIVAAARRLLGTRPR
jgi:hypothetical protein